MPAICPLSQLSRGLRFNGQVQGIVTVHCRLRFKAHQFWKPTRGLQSVHGVHGSLLQLQEAWISPRVTCAEKLGADLQMLQAKGYLLGHASECAN